MAERHRTDMTTEVSVHYPSGGKVVVYNSIDRNTDDYQRIFSCAGFFARQGKTAIITPKLDVPYKNPAYDQIYGSLKNTAYYGKCPDMQVDGIWYEHEGYTTVNPKANFSNMLHRGLIQSDHIIIEKCNLSERIMRKSIRDRLRSGIVIKEIWIHEDNRLNLLFLNTEGQ